MVNRQAKLKELKTNIKLATDEFKHALADYKEITKDEGRKEELPALRKELGIKESILQALGEELVKTKMNKTGSTAFEWIPSPPNRRVRRHAARQRA